MNLPNPDQIWPNEVVLADIHRENMPRALHAKLQKAWAEEEDRHDRRTIEAERRAIVARDGGELS